jgi:hydrogenase nickel incorporation protein HypB
MCETCGCTITPGNAHLVKPEGRLERTAEGRATVEVLASLLHENDHQAAHNREHFDRHGVLALNLMSSPGSGKTSLLEATIDALAGEFSIAVIEGDLETENDAERIRARGVPAVQITTGQACHLDAHMVHDALHGMEREGLNFGDLDLLFIENVGNLVCTTSYDLGESCRIALLSVTEGEDKPLKYPGIYNSADAVVITKIDLAEACEFDRDAARAHLFDVRPGVRLIETSAKTGQGLDDWLAFLDDRRRAAEPISRSAATAPPSAARPPDARQSPSA